jgi:hypothetical protein
MQINCNSEKITSRILLSFDELRKKLPSDVIKIVEEHCIIWVMGFECDSVINKPDEDIIFLNWFTIDKIMHCNDEELQFIIAHELAYFILDHAEREITNELRFGAKEVNELLKTWGFSRPEKWNNYYSK